MQPVHSSHGVPLEIGVSCSRLHSDGPLYSVCKIHISHPVSSRFFPDGDDRRSSTFTIFSHLFFYSCDAVFFPTRRAENGTFTEVVKTLRRKEPGENP